MRNLKYLALLTCIVAVALAGCSSSSSSNCVAKGGDCSLLGALCCTNLECNATTKLCVDKVACVPENGDCSLLGALCCTGFDCNATSKKCTKCVAEGGDCSLLGALCCGGTVCDADKKCTPCITLGKECEDSTSCCQPSDVTKGAFCDMNLDIPLCAVCQQKDGTCATDFDCCEADVTPDGKDLICASTKKCAPMCKKNADCQTTDHPTWICMSGECMAPACTSDDDCGGKKCCSGACVTDCGYGPADHCQIVTKGTALIVGQSSAMSAVAYKGDLIKGTAVPGAVISWTADAGGVVSVSAAGKVTALKAGTGTVTAKTGLIECGSVSFTVVDAVVGGAQVLVVDESTGAPVVGASVIIGSQTIATNASGVAAGFTAGGDVHVLDTNHVYVSIIGVTGSNYLVYLPPTPPSDTVKSKKGGFHGAADYSAFAADSQKITLAIASNTITGNLLDLDFMTLIGEMLLTHIELKKSDGAPLDVDEWMYLPGAAMAGAALFNKPILVPEYRVLGVEGLRAAWALGAGLSNNDVTKLVSAVTPCIGDSIDIGCILAGALPVISKFKSAIQSAFNVVPIDTITTTCQMTTGKSATKTSALCGNVPGMLPLVETPFMADYAKFPKIDLKLSQSMGVQATFTIANMPKLMGTCMSGVAMLGGTYIPGVGMLPLGLTAGTAAKDSTDCSIVWAKSVGLLTNQLQISQAPNHSGTEGNPYMAVFMSLNFSELGGGTSNALSGRVLLGKAAVAGGDISSKPFMGFDEGSSFTASAKQVETKSVANATFYRFQLENDVGKWLIYTAAPAVVTLPDAGAARITGADAAVHAIESSVSLSDLLTKSDGSLHMNNLFDVVTAFSTVSCLTKLPPADDKCKTTPPAAACNPACTLK